MEKIIEIIMNRDGYDYDEAKAIVEDIRQKLIDLIEIGYGYDDIEFTLMEELGLEMDYFEDLIF